MKPGLKPAPWDSAALGFEAYEVLQVSEEVLEETTTRPGLYVARVDPLASKQLLAQFGYYYCDTLAQPYGVPDRFTAFDHVDVKASRDVPLPPLETICR